MKILVLAIALIFSTSLFAEEGNKWMERRDKRVAKMTEKMGQMQKNIDCFKAATTKDAFKACKATVKAQRKAWKEMRKNNKK